MKSTTHPERAGLQGRGRRSLGCRLTRHGSPRPSGEPHTELGPRRSRTADRPSSPWLAGTSSTESTWTTRRCARGARRSGGGPRTRPATRPHGPWRPRPAARDPDRHQGHLRHARHADGVRIPIHAGRTVRLSTQRVSRLRGGSGWSRSESSSPRSSPHGHLAPRSIRTISPGLRRLLVRFDGRSRSGDGAHRVRHMTTASIISAGGGFLRRRGLASPATERFQRRASRRSRNRSTPSGSSPGPSPTPLLVVGALAGRPLEPPRDTPIPSTRDLSDARVADSGTRDRGALRRAPEALTQSGARPTHLGLPTPT